MSDTPTTPDPLDRLSHFSEGLDVPPPPPADVRRRGDRLRRRRRVLAAAGGVAVAVVLVAVPVMVLGGGDDRARGIDPAVTPTPSVAATATPSVVPDPTADPTAAPTTDPTTDPTAAPETSAAGAAGEIAAADLPLADGLVNDDGTPVRATPGGEGVLLPDDFCGAVWPPASSTDRLVASASGPEYREAHEVVTFATADEAVAVLAGLRTAVTQCPLLPESEPIEGLDGSRPVTSYPDLQSTYADSATFAVTYTEGLGGSVFQFVRAGRAVLATQVDGETSTASARSVAEALNEGNAPLLQRLCVFTAAGC